MNHMMKNNLFYYGTSELSQDAFICYLVSHAMLEFSNQDIALTQCAKDLLALMLPDQTQDELIVANIMRQYKNIDILITLNTGTYIVVEDKTFSSQHSDQINRYAEIVRTDFGKEPICVYYKIVEQDWPEPNVINIGRNDLLPIFQMCQSENQIFRNYLEYLEYIDNDANAYIVDKEITGWRNKYNHVYRGFFKHLATDVIAIKDYGWGYVNNAAGGFWGMWWGWLSAKEMEASGLLNSIDEIYLQIEDNKIAVKITNRSGKSGASDTRWKLYNYFCNKVSSFNKGYFRKGNTMTVGYVYYSMDDYREKITMMEQTIGELTKAI